MWRGLSVYLGSRSSNCIPRRNPGEINKAGMSLIAVLTTSQVLPLKYPTRTANYNYGLSSLLPSLYFCIYHSHHNPTGCQYEGCCICLHDIFLLPASMQIPGKSCCPFFLFLQCSFLTLSLSLQQSLPESTYLTL